MYTEKMRHNHERLQAFLKSDERKLELEVDCPIEERVSYTYRVIFPGFEKYRFYWRFFLARLASFIDYSPIKVFLYRRMGIRIGKGAFIAPGVILDPHFPELIEIGEYAIIGWGTHLFTHECTGTHFLAGRIRIGRGAVIGGFSVVRGGVNIGENAKVASTCIVYKDVPQNYCMDSVILLNRALLEVYRKDVDGQDI